MYHKIRITAVSLSVIMLCIFSSVSTLSYFTDTDSVTNNFVVGNAATDLMIYEDVSGENKVLLDASKEDYRLRDNLDIPFVLQAENKGNIPVFQRFRVVIPIELTGIVTLNLPVEGCAIDATSSEVQECDDVQYSVKYDPSVREVEGEQPKYTEYYIVSKDSLGLGEKTKEWPTTNLHIGSLSSLAEEDRTRLTTCEGEDGNNCVLGIKVYSDAIQTTGFNNAKEAFDALRETY